MDSRKLIRFGTSRVLSALDMTAFRSVLKSEHLPSAKRDRRVVVHVPFYGIVEEITETAAVKLIDVVTRRTEKAVDFALLSLISHVVSGKDANSTIAKAFEILEGEHKLPGSVLVVHNDALHWLESLEDRTGGSAKPRGRVFGVGVWTTSSIPNGCALLMPEIRVNILQEQFVLCREQYVGFELSYELVESDKARGVLVRAEDY